MGDFQNIFSNMILIGLFMIALFGFIITSQYDNNAEEPVADDYLFNDTYNNFKTQISSNTQTSNDNYLAFNEENPTIDSGAIILSTITSGGKVFGGMIFGIFNLLIKIPAQKLGLSQEITGVILIILTISIIIGIWALLKWGG